MNTDILFLIIMLIVFLTAMIASLWILCAKRHKGGIPQVYLVTAVSELGKREEQQDAVWFSGMQEQLPYVRIQAEDDCLAVVADGMGGLKNGGVISHIIAEGMRDAFFSPDRPKEPVPFLQNALWKVNQSVNAYLDICGNENGGSTIITAYLYEGRLYFLSVGDSRIYLVHENHISKLNIEHTFGNELDDLAMQGVISKEEAQQNHQRAALTSYVGMGDITKVDGNVEPIPLEKGDMVLLMSDGVFGTISEKELLACAKEKNITDTTERIKEAVEACGKLKQDNYSVIAIRVL